MPDEILATAEAFHPDSPHWGAMLGPAAIVIPADRCCPDCERPILLCRCGGGEKYMDDFESG